MTGHANFPDLPLDQWVDLWQRGYGGKYGDDDQTYAELMDAVHATSDFEVVVPALKRFFTWKDRFGNRWIHQVDRLTENVWTRCKSSVDVPPVWRSGAVYNVFLWHVATRGKSRSLTNTLGVVIAS